MDIIVTGGRDYSDTKKMKDVLNLFDFNLLIQGGASGADMLAYDYCNERGITCHTENANWTQNGKSAGPLRNRKMIAAFPNAIVIAFPGGRGTENCVKQAKNLGMIVLRVG